MPREQDRRNTSDKDIRVPLSPHRDLGITLRNYDSADSGKIPSGG